MVEINVPFAHAGMRKQAPGTGESAMRNVYLKYRAEYITWMENGMKQSEYTKRVGLGALDYQEFKKLVIESLKKQSERTLNT